MNLDDILKSYQEIMKTHGISGFTCNICSRAAKDLQGGYVSWKSDGDWALMCNDCGRLIEYYQQKMLGQLVGDAPDDGDCYDCTDIHAIRV